MNRAAVFVFAAMATASAFAAPTYDQALTYRNALYAVASQSTLKLTKPDGFRSFSIEVSKLEPTAIKLFGTRDKAGEFESCVNAAGFAREHWQSQMTAVSQSQPLQVGFSARAGFEFGKAYAQCSTQIETLYRAPPGPPLRPKIIELSKTP